jgi:lipoprotein-releasing system permease protein
MLFELIVATRYLRSRRKQVMLSVITAIAVVAVSVGVAALVVVTALMTGFRDDMQERILSGTAHINVVRRGGLPIPDHELVANRLRRVPGVAAAAPTLYQTVLIEGLEAAAGATVKGVDLSAPRDSNEVFRLTVEGDAARLAERIENPDGDRMDTIVLGRTLAESVGLRVGDVATLVSPGGQITKDEKITPRYRDFVVVGLFESGLYDYDSTWAYVSLDGARRLVGQADVVQVIQMQVRDIYAVKEVGAAVLAELGAGYEVRDWQELNEPLYAALALERLGFYVVLVVVVTVAALNIITLLTMMVMEKTSDIGILKSMGATNAAVMRIFMWQGLVIGAVGAAVGIALGAALVWYLDTYQVISLPPDVYSISHVSFRIRAFDVAVIAAATVGISFLATIYPARSAAKLDPVEALRYE